MSDPNPARDAVVAYLERRDLAYDERDGAVLVAFGRDGATDAAFTVRLQCDTAGIAIDAASARGLPAARWEPALWTVNEWNATVRAPKAVLIATAATDATDATATTDASDDERLAHIVLQDWMPYANGVPAEVVDAFLDTALAGASLFWQNATNATAQ
jgi:hypothetical protein